MSKMCSDLMCPSRYKLTLDEREVRTLRSLALISLKNMISRGNRQIVRLLRAVEPVKLS